MSDTNTNLPLSTDGVVAKPSAPKPAAKSPASKLPAAELITKTSPANPAWAEEVAAQFGLSSNLAKVATVEILDAVNAEITTKFSRSRLAKCVRYAVLKAIN